eukprot:3994918-Amphidinium_carterae.1
MTALRSAVGLKETTKERTLSTTCHDWKNEPAFVGQKSMKFRSQLSVRPMFMQQGLNILNMKGWLDKQGGPPFRVSGGKDRRGIEHGTGSYLCSN